MEIFNLREMKHVYTKTCTQIFIAALFTIAKIRNNSNIHQHDVVYPSNGILFSKKKGMN